MRKILVALYLSVQLTLCVVFRRDPLPIFGFNYSEHQLPLSYKTYDQSIELLSRIKLISPVQNKSGAIILQNVRTLFLIKQQLESLNYEIDVQYEVRGDLTQQNGFQIMLLKKEFDRITDYGDLNGIRKDFNGVGIFVYQSVKKSPGQWYVVMLQNKGLVRFQSIEDLILDSNSCKINITQKVPKIIKINRSQDSIELSIWNEDRFKLCNRQGNLEVFKPYFGLIASNRRGKLNDVDVLAVKIVNMDNRVYQDLEALDQQRLMKLAIKNDAGITFDENKAHGHDLISVKLQEEIQIGQKKLLVMIDENDHTFDVLFKYFETLRNYEKGLEEFTVMLGETTANIDDKFQRTGKKNKQDRLGEYLKKLEEKTKRVRNEYEGKIRTVLNGVFNSSFAEEMSQLRHNEYKININQVAMKSHDNINISPVLSKKIQQLREEVDTMMRNLTRDLQEIKSFREDFPENCINQLLNKKNVDESIIKNRKIPNDIVRAWIEILKDGAVQFKYKVDKDNEAGFPILRLIVLVLIGMILFLIWDKLNQSMQPGSKVKKAYRD